MTNKHRLFYLIIIFPLMLLLSACHFQNKTEPARYSKTLYYDFHTRKLVRYNKTEQSGSFLSKNNNQFQYSVDFKNLFIDGNSLTNNFSLITLENNKVKKLATFPKNESLIPFGKKANKIYVIHSYYEADNNEIESKRRIAVYDMKSKKISDFKNTKGLSVAGAISSENVYYTVYHNKTRDFSLFEVDRNNLASVPVLVKSGLKDDNVLVYQDHVFYAEGKKLVSDNRSFTKKDDNFFYHNSLIQLYINDDNELSMKITNLKTNRTLVVNDFIGARIKGNMMKICLPGKVINHEL
ncbi:MAG: hypothetical protein Q3960_02305 [Lactobacillus sp.]|nr:hypothetical protein [Lactobacillus sp.]